MTTHGNQPGHQPGHPRPESGPTRSDGADGRTYILHVLAVSTLALTQPVLDQLAQAPDFFVARGLSAPQIVFLVALLWLAPVAAVAVAAVCVGRVAGRRARRAVHLGALGLATLALALLVLRRTPIDSAPAVLVLGASAGALVIWAHPRSPVLRAVLSVLALLSVVPPALFLFASPVSRLVLPDPQDIGMAGSAAEPLVRPSVPLVFVVLDELPASSLVAADGTVDADLFPHLARFETTATRFPDHSAAAVTTLQALPTLLVGQYPMPERLATYEDYPGNLFTFLAASHEIFAFEARTRLCPETLCRRGPPPDLLPLAADLGWLYLHLVSPAAWAHRLPDVRTNWEQFDALDDKGARIRAFVESLPLAPAGEKPPFVFLHAELPHHPWIYLPSGRSYDPGPEMFMDGIARGGLAMTGSWVDDPWVSAQALQRHLLQLAYTDDLLGRLLRRLQDAEIFDDALIVVTADHGISFRPGARVRSLETSSFDDITGVPLWIKWPGQRSGDEDSRPASAVDVATTIADVLGVVLPWATEGHSLLDPARPTDRRRVVFATPKHGVWIPRLPPPQARDAATRRRSHSPHSPQDEGPGGLFRWVPETPPGLASLLGTDPAEFSAPSAPAPSSSWSAELYDAARFLDVDPTADVLPSRVRGRIHGLPPDRRQRPALALAIGGRIRAVTLPRVDAGALGSISFMVPDDVWKAGTNVLQLFEISGSGPDAWSLTRIPLQPSSADP